MYCPNCKQEYEGKFCPECGTKLIEKPAMSGVSLNLGDANAISGGLHVSDSHAVHNEDNSVHNITNTTSTVNNITQVSAQKTEMEVLQEKKAIYLNECKRAYEDNVLEQSEVVVLEECRIKLGLDKSTADAILESVRVMSDRNARKSELNPIAKTKLKILTSNLQKNEVKALMDQIDSLEPLVRRFDHDELSRKYYLVLAALKPEKCIEQKERIMTDTYWEAFWSYLAYIKAGRLIDAEETLATLDHFSNYPEDNMTVLAAAGELMKRHPEEAKEYLDATTGEYTPALQRFVDSIYLLLEPETAKEMGADENTCAFYLVNFFGQKDPKAKVEEERIRKAKEEEEAKRKAKEEEARKAKEAEEARKRAEEERRRLEAERKAKEEAIRKAKKAEEAKRRAEEAKRKAEEKAKREAEAKKKSADEAHLKAEAKAKAEEEDQRRAEEDISLKATSANNLYDIILVERGTNTLLVVRAIKDALKIDLDEAKTFFDNAPATLRKGVCKDEAERIKNIVEVEGAVIDIKISDEKIPFDTNENTTPRKVVSKLLNDLVGGFEIIHAFRKNEPYKVCRYLITQKEWEIIMGSNPSSKKGNDFPVTNITLDESEIFVRRVNEIVAKEFPIYGVEFIIPTLDMQWHGYQKKFSEAFNILPRELYCWFDANSHGQLQPVGQLQPSADIYDACGLVYEWCDMKRYDSLFGGSVFESREKLIPELGNSSSIRYRDKRYADVGLRLVAFDK